MKTARYSSKCWLPALLAACLAGGTSLTLAETMPAGTTAAPAAEPPATEAPAAEAPAVEAPAAEAPAAEAAAAEAPATEAADTSAAEPGDHYSWRRDRGRYDEYLDARRQAQRQQLAARRDAMERWRSFRRWWNDPVSEDRRQWNRARFDFMRRLGDDRSRAMDDWYDWQRENVERYRPGPWHPGGPWGWGGPNAW